MERKISGKGWDGVLYPVGGRKDRIMIILSGSEGGVSDAKKLAVYPHDNGIPVLALGYFRTKHSPKYLHLIPVEIIGNAIKTLKKLGYKRIGIEGLSSAVQV